MNCWNWNKLRGSAELVERLQHDLVAGGLIEGSENILISHMQQIRKAIELEPQNASVKGPHVTCGTKILSGCLLQQHPGYQGNIEA